MRQLILLALPLLAACGEGRDATGAAALPEDGAPDAVVANAQAAAEPQQWFERRDPDGDWAGYGPPFSEAAFSLRCERAAGRLVFNTTEMPRSGPGETVMHLKADGFDQSIDAIANEDGLPNTDAAVPADAPWLAQLLAASGTLTVRVGGGDPLDVPISEPFRALIRDCAAGRR